MAATSPTRLSCVLSKYILYYHVSPYYCTFLLDLLENQMQFTIISNVFVATAYDFTESVLVLLIINPK